MKSMFITINHINDFGSYRLFRVGDCLELVKEEKNDVDDEAIAVYNLSGNKCGYVANSVDTVARGTYSAGRLYDYIGDNADCVVCFVMQEGIVAEIIKRKDEGRQNDKQQTKQPNEQQCL